jgi:hypothetical protein
MSDVLWQRAMLERLRREGLLRYLDSTERTVCTALAQRFARTGALAPALGKLLTVLLGRAVARQQAARQRLAAVRGSRNGDAP